MIMTPTPFSLRPAVCSEEGQSTCKRYSYPFSTDTLPLLVLEPVPILARVSTSIRADAVHNQALRVDNKNKIPTHNQAEIIHEMRDGRFNSERISSVANLPAK